MILNEDDYIASVHKLLDDKTTYERINNDPTIRIQTANNILVERWIEKKYISKIKGGGLLSANAVIPRLYALPKIHKANNSFRPIVSSILGPTYKLSKFVQQSITNVSKNTPSYVKDSFQFKDFITKITIPDGYVLLSLDVSSLYTNVPLERVRNALKSRKDALSTCNSSKNIPINELIKAVNLIMENTCFLFNNEFFKQKTGLPMGSPLAPPAAEIVMQDLETTCLKFLEDAGIQLPFYKRYVDGIITAVPNDKIDLITELFNSYDTKLQFTHEVEENNTIAFLDLLLVHDGNKVLTNWFHKKTWSGRYLNFFSHHPIGQKKGVVSMLVGRAMKLSHQKFHEDNLALIKIL